MKRVRRSTARWVILVAILVAAIGAAYWWFAVRARREVDHRITREIPFARPSKARFVYDFSRAF
jgi:hypothetical protein